MEEEREQEKNKWLDFNAKVCGISYTKSCTNIYMLKLVNICTKLVRINEMLRSSFVFFSSGTETKAFHTLINILIHTG